MTKRIDENNPMTMAERGHLGGSIAGPMGVKNKIGIHGRTPEQMHEDGVKGGQITGRMAADNKIGIHGRSSEQWSEDSRKGGLLGGVMWSHIRWHVSRELFSDHCSYCQAESAYINKEVGKVYQQHPELKALEPIETQSFATKGAKRALECRIETANSKRQDYLMSGAFPTNLIALRKKDGPPLMIAGRLAVVGGYGIEELGYIWAAGKNARGGPDTVAKPVHPLGFGPDDTGPTIYSKDLTGGSALYKYLAPKFVRVVLLYLQNNVTEINSVMLCLHCKKNIHFEFDYRMAFLHFREFHKPEFDLTISKAKVIHEKKAPVRAFGTPKRKYTRKLAAIARASTL
jgi:hypothetical protein